MLSESIEQIALSQQQAVVIERLRRERDAALVEATANHRKVCSLERRIYLVIYCVQYILLHYMALYYMFVQVATLFYAQKEEEMSRMAQPQSEFFKFFLNF